jgi:hypothetical protein
MLQDDAILENPARHTRHAPLLTTTISKQRLQSVAVAAKKNEDGYLLAHTHALKATPHLLPWKQKMGLHDFTQCPDAFSSTSAPLSSQTRVLSGSAVSLFWSGNLGNEG